MGEQRHARSPDGARRLQQRHIAEVAGVSISTVSRVLNNVEGISLEVRERVLKAATSLGYQPKKERMEHVDLFISTSHASLDPFRAAIMSGIEKECRNHDIRLSYISFEREADTRSFILEKVRQHGNSGLIFLSYDDRELLEHVLTLNFRVVLINAEHDGLPIDTFLPDNHYAPRQVVRHLIEHGHRAILHITQLERVTIRHRYAAYRAVLEEAGIPFNPALVLQTDLSPTHAYEALKNFLASDHPAFTAIFCANDFATMGVVRALQEAGLRVPEDVSLVGYDDISLSAFMTPPLTTVRIECEEMGRLAVRRLLDRVANPQLVPIRAVLFSPLIKRQSVTFARPIDEQNR